ncbi:type IV toxin-antitoxin system AbiEi family antitoxin domain-containing protein [Thermomonas aquatica]|uniref:Transcriptional regulator n=1 Tax=Thermomonas aquatica TaxID=2202149 RepID=A0A5B7ZSN2_9GAMM|nr:type IV toxin-antitoxin system AbiEi family antitoxin domain-containing protein [Thermomonas aquatica]QDA57675.1 transcriptional regulator [Thermomonas aquatica]
MTDPAAIAKALIQHKGAVRSRELVDAGVARVQLSRLVAAGELIRLARGVYTAPGVVLPGSEEGVLVVAERIPEARLCLLTALRLHGLTTQAPFEVWIAIGNKDRLPRLDWPPLRVLRFSGEALTAGLETRTMGSKQVRVTNVAKTVADCFKFRNLVGLDVAIEALRDALRARATSVDELWKYAQICRVTTVMRPYLEALA